MRGRGAAAATPGSPSGTALCRGLGDVLGQGLGAAARPLLGQEREFTVISSGERPGRFKE